MADPLSAIFLGTAATSGSAAAATLGIGQVAAATLGSSLVAPATVGLLGSGGVFSLAAGSLSTFDLITGGLSAFSAISSIVGGQAAKAASETGARFEEFGAKTEILKGRKEALAILEAENQILESNLVATLASGITGEGSPKAAQEAIISKAEFELGITETTAEINAAARRARATQFRLEGQASSTQGVASAVGDVAGFFLSRARRGSV